MGTFDDLIPSFQDLVPKQEMKPGIMPRIAGGALAFGQGGLPVFDELGAYIGDKINAGGNIPYEERLKNIRGLEQAFAEENPKTDIGLRIGGAVAGTAPLAGAMAARPIAAGAAYGVAQGFTGSEGGAANRIFGGTAGGALGAGGGYVAEKLLGPGAVYLSEKLGVTPKPKLSLKEREINTIKKNLDLAGVSPQEYAANLLRSTKDDFAGELGGEPLRVQTQTQAKITGPAMQSAREAMRERLLQAPERAKKIVQDVLGSDKESDLLLSGLDIAKGAEKTLYGAVQDTVKSADLAKIMDTPAGQSALKQAAVNLANAQVNPLEAGFVKTLDKAGNELYSLAENIPASTAHEISKALGDLVKRNPNTGAIEDAASMKVESLRNKLVDLIRENSLEFNAAQENAAQVRSAQDALSKGRNLARSAAGERSEDVMASVLRNEDNNPFIKAGFKQGLYDVMESVPLGTGNPISRIAQQKIAGRIGEISGKDAEKSFVQKAMAEKLRMELANRGLYGSNTAETASSGISNIPFSKYGAISKAFNKFDDIINAKSNERLASALYARSPEEKMELAKLIMGKDADLYIPDESKRNAMIELLRKTIPSIPAQTGGAIVNSPDIPTVNIYKKRGE